MRKLSFLHIPAFKKARYNIGAQKHCTSMVDVIPTAGGCVEVTHEDDSTETPRMVVTHFVEGERSRQGRTVRVVLSQFIRSAQ